MTEPLNPYTIHCAHCGKPAATFTCIPAGVALEANDLWSDRDRLRREGFMGSLLHFSFHEKLDALFWALANHDYEAIAREANPDLVGFHCWKCSADYCQNCWDIGPPQFDDDFPGFYDCTYAVCPHGHQQVVDD